MDGKKASGSVPNPHQRKDSGQTKSTGSKEPQVKLFVKSVDEKTSQRQKGEKEKEPEEVFLSDNEDRKAEDVVVVLSDNEEPPKKVSISDAQYFGTLPENEQKYLKKNVIAGDGLESKNVVCTACKKTIDFKAEGTLFRHPVLAVPVCEKCHEFYTSSCWSKDEEGFDEQCRWCANGGEMLLCDSCKNVFCQRCIRRNLGRSKVKEIEEADEWNCLVCEPKQIRSLRVLFYSLWAFREKKRTEDKQMATKMIEKQNREFSEKIREGSMETKHGQGSFKKVAQEAAKDSKEEAKSKKADNDEEKKMKQANSKSKSVGTFALVEDKSKYEESGNVKENEKIETKNEVPNSGTSNSTEKILQKGEKEKHEPTEKTNEATEIASTSKTTSKNSFMEDTLRDGFDVNKILGDYLKKANKSWDQKKDEELGEDGLVKMVVKLRTIVKITRHNLDLLDANLVSGCLAAFPGLDPDRLRPLAIEGEQPKQQEEGKDKDKDCKNPRGDSNETKLTEKCEKNTSNQSASNESPVKTREDGKNPFEDEGEGKSSPNILDEKTNISLRQTSNQPNNKSATPGSLKSQKASLDKENLAARAVVLQSTSSETDQAIIIESEEDSFSPRKKLKTKKELDDLRRKSVAKTADESNFDNVDTISSSSSLEGTSPKKSQGRRDFKTSSDNSDEDQPRVVANSSGGEEEKKRSKKMFGAASAKRAAGEKEATESDSDNEAGARREEERLNRLTIGKLQKLREVAANIDPKCAKLTRQNLRVNVKMLGADIKHELSKSNKRVVKAQLEDLAEKQKQKKKRRDRELESDEEDSRIDRHELEGGRLPFRSHKLLSSSHRHGRSKTFVVTFTFSSPPRLPPSPLMYLNLIFSFRLCDLGTLKRSRKGSGERGGVGSGEEGDGSGGHLGGEVHQQHKRSGREKALRLGDISSDSGSGGSDRPVESEDESPRVGQSQEDLARAAVIASSSDESVLGRDSSEDSEEEGQPSKIPKSLPKDDSKTKKDRKRKFPGSSSAEERRPKSKKLSLLSMRLTESDSSEEERKHRARMEKRNAKGNGATVKNGGGSGDSDDSDFEPSVLVAKKKKQPRKKKARVESENEASEDSDLSEESEEEEEEEVEEAPKKKTSRKKKKSSSSDDDSDEDSDEPKKKRSRIKGGSESEDDEKTPTKRHNIKKVIKEKNLAEETKTAAAEERDRRKRVEERQAAYNKTFGDTSGQNKDTVLEKLVLDFDPDTKKVLVEVNPKLVKKLKPHQADGIKFMWDSVFESVAQFKAGKIPGGAILAHCMGLGKTLQSVTLTHTVMTQRKVALQRVMVICPVNVVKNWKDEFDKWLPGDMGLDVTEMSGEKDNWGRADRIGYWYNEGGVILIGYDMFRNLTNADNKKFKKKQREVFNRCLLDPGPELVICDEGHLLKNEKSAINKAVNRIKTPRRIILTGTPLQNNLKEYYEMVNFVKPNLMGTRKEFMNRFVNPIVNGQHSDSTERDIRMMKKRSFILNDLLKGCMQRLDYNVLVPYLMPKQEYVITIQLTDLQKKLYRFYLENYAKAGQIGADGKLEGGKKGGLFYDVQNLSRIWNHPYILVLSKMRKDAKEDDDEEGSLKDFICDEDEESDVKDTEDEDSDIQEVDEDGFGVQAKRRATRADKAEDLVALEDMEIGRMGASGGWWNQFLGDEQNLDDIALGSKMVLLMDILKESAMIGDKVLVFSQSILSLDLIEEFLGKVNDAHESDKGKDSALGGYLDTWVPGKDYYRMDGSTPADTRKIWCKFFNRATSHRMRLFLISTKAGGLGINLVAANRVIIFDASWNPSHDVQSIFRVFRFGQTKPVYVYRFLAKGTMEEKIYDRQVTKQSLAARVVDEHQIESHFTMNELAELYEFNDEPMSARPTPVVPEDRLLAELVDKHKEMVWNIHNHDSLLENKVDENLTEEERKAAWDEYDQEKKGLIQTNVGMENLQQFGMMLQTMLPKSGDGRIMASPINPMAIQAQLRQMNPELSHEELVSRTRAAIMQLQNMHRTQTPVIVNQNTLNVGQRQTTGYDQSFYQAEMAKAKAMIQQQYPGMYRFRSPSPQSAPSLAGQAPAYMQQMQMLAQQRANNSNNEVITLDDRPTPHLRMPGPSRGRGRGGRRGRPRLDPDTDIDFSPEPSTFSQAEVLARLQQAGMTVTNTTRKKDGNES